MSHIHVPDQIPVKYLPRSKGFTLFAGALFVVGLAAFIFGLTVDADAAWQGYVVNWLYFTSLAAGATLLAVATNIVKAKWNWSIRRVSLAFVAFLPISFLLLLPMLSLGENYFPWIGMMESDPIVQKKAAYLNLDFLRVRNVLGFGLLVFLAVTFAKLALRPDMGRTQNSGDADAGRAKWRDKFLKGWTDQDAEEERSYQKMLRLGPAFVLCYAAVMSMLTIDWAMGLEPHWFSTMFGPWFFMGAFWGGIAVTAFTMIRLKAGDVEFDHLMGRQQLHDLGKLAFAFTVFWAYLFFSQYLVIWYGKLPWEQAWIVRRSAVPWGPLFLTMVILCFVVPFAGLIGRKPKMNPKLLGFFAIVIMAGLWLDRFMLIVPSLHHEGDPVLSIWVPAVGLMFLGLFLLSVRWFLSTFPVIQLWQPKPDPETVEAEIRDAEVVAAG